MRELLTQAQLADALTAILEWRHDPEEQSICRNYLFPEFRVAMQFVNAIAEAAEELDHHPDIDIRFHKVRLELTTHSAGGLTRLDFELAGRADAFAEAMGVKNLPGNCF